MANEQQAPVSASEANKIMYFYKRIQHESPESKIHILGLQGATSGTNTKAVQKTQSKQGNLNTYGVMTQQRTVDVIQQKPQPGHVDVIDDLRNAQNKDEEIGLWRVDFNQVAGTKPNRTVVAAFSKAMVTNVPSQEALAGAPAANIPFQVDGEEQAYNVNEDKYVLPENSFEDGVFDQVTKFYGFSLGTDLGVDDSGKAVDNTKDDSALTARDRITQEDITPASTASTPGNEK